MKKILIFIVTNVLFFSPFFVKADLSPQALTTDQRMRIVNYDPNNVVTIHANQLIQTSIQFSEEENIVGVESGDSVAWTVNINPNKPNILFIKPTTENSDTNLSVITNKNTYQFHLITANNDAKPHRDATYNLRFVYPVEEKAKLLAQLSDQRIQKNSLVSETPVNPMQWNWDYSFSKRCSNKLIPAHVFDDGKFTYFQFAQHKDIPAIFVVDNQGKESLANWRMQGKYVVVERTAQQFSLRNGVEVSCVLNDAISS